MVLLSDFFLNEPQLNTAQPQPLPTLMQGGADAWHEFCHNKEMSDLALSYHRSAFKLESS